MSLFKRLVAFDKKCNKFFGPIFNKVLNPPIKFGGHNETLSSVMGKNRKVCKFCGFICMILHKIDPRHCEKAVHTHHRENFEEVDK